jgi:glycosyltransferase involved in cell wall biosynthesis
MTSHSHSLHLLIVLDGLINAGTEKSTLEIIRHFSDRTKVSVAYLYPHHQLKSDYESVADGVYFLDLKGKYNFATGIKRLSHLIRRLQPDLVLSSMMRANLVARFACYRLKKPLVGTFVSDSYNQERQEAFGFSRKMSASFFKTLDRFTARIPVAYIANSQSIAQSNRKHLALEKKKIVTIYRGRDAGKIPVWKEPVQQPFHFISFGRLLVSKGYGDLLEAMALLKKKQVRCKLTILGEGIYRATLESFMEKNNLTENVYMPGNRPDAVSHLMHAHCFVFPTWYEGFSGALVEAMLSGIPIIASDIPMNLEAVTHQEASIARVKDAQSIAACMEEVMSNYALAVSKGAKARQRALQLFEVREVAAEYESFLWTTKESAA